MKVTLLAVLAALTPQHSLALKLADRPRDKLAVPKLLKLDNAGTLFRTQDCKNLNTQWNLLNWGGLSSEEVAMMDLVEMQNSSASSPRVACLMYSYDGARQKQRDSYATWGQDCDEFLAFSNEAWEDKEAGFKTIEVHPEDGNERNLIGKLRKAYAEVLRRVKAKELSFDFLTVSGDDDLWLISNLKHQLSTNEKVLKAQKDGKGLLYGHMARHRRDRNNFYLYPHGGAYVVDLKAIETYMANADKGLVDNSGWDEDVNFGRTMTQEGVPFIDDFDETGAHQMHVWEKLGEVNKRDWFPSELENLPQKTGTDMISKNTVVFHYADGPRRWHMHNQLHSKSICEA